MAEGQPTDPVGGLVDIPLPAEVTLWPQTWPSRILLLVVASGLILGTLWAFHRWRVNRYRRDALSELARIEARAATCTTAELSVALAALVRRTALAAFPRERVASLTDTAWLSFLDRTGGRPAFSELPGRALEISAYRQAPDVEPSELIKAVRSWIKEHRGERVP